MDKEDWQHNTDLVPELELNVNVEDEEKRQFDIKFCYNDCFCGC